MRSVPIFPLPETVFFPFVSLPLHVFEPRYRQMTTDVISGDGLMVVVLLRPGWQNDYHGNPPVHDVATLGSIEAHEELPDGRFNIVLRGLERVRLLPASEDEEGTEVRRYRVRRLRPEPESPAEPGTQTTALAVRLRHRWRELSEKSGASADEGSLGGEDLPFEHLVNRLSSSVDVSPAMKQRLLEANDFVSRAALLETYIEEALRFWRTLARFRRVAPKDPAVN